MSAVLALNEMTTYRWTLEQDIQQYKAAGIPALGVWRRKLSDCGEEKGIELLNASGLNVSSLLWAGGFTGSDGHSFRESMEDAREAIRLAAAMNAGCLVVYTGARAGHTHNHARRLMKGALSELAPLAAEAGVTLAIEPMHPECAAEWTFLTTLEETLALIAAVESPAIKLVYDVYHLCQDGLCLERLAQLVPHLALVQLGDTRIKPSGEQNRCRLGEGTLPLPQVVSTLTAAGYRGFFEVELMGEEIETSNYNELVTHTKTAFEKMMA